MKPTRLWMEIAALGTATACALALLIATLGAATVAVTSRSESGQVESVQIESVQAEPVPAEPVQANASTTPRSVHEGMVTCSRCGAKHSADLGKTAMDCTRECVHGGATFALVNGDKTYQLDGDLQLLRKVAGQRARIAGQLHGNTIKVTSIEATT
jgi:hypothetical protein